VPRALLSSRGSALNELLASGKRIPMGELAGIHRASSEASREPATQEVNAGNTYLTDRSGARWPITGHLCGICGWPANGVLKVYDYRHPLCLYGESTK